MNGEKEQEWKVVRTIYRLCSIGILEFCDRSLQPQKNYYSTVTDKLSEGGSNH